MFHSFELHFKYYMIRTRLHSDCIKDLYHKRNFDYRMKYNKKHLLGLFHLHLNIYILNFYHKMHHYLTGTSFHF